MSRFIILHAVRCSYAPSVLMCCVLFFCWSLNFSGKAQRPNVFWGWEQLYTQSNNECLFFKLFLPLFPEIIQISDIYDAAENQNNVFKTWINISASLAVLLKFLSYLLVFIPLAQNSLLCDCGRLTLAGCQVPTEAALSLLSPAGQWRENATKGS